MKDIETLEKKLVRQDNAVTNAHYRMSVLEKNLFLALLGELSEHDEERKNYQIDVKKLEKLTQTKTGFKQYKAATKKLIQRVLELKGEKTLNGKVRKTTLQVPLFASVEYIHGTGLIEIEISEKFRPYLFDLKRNFTQYSLAHALRFRSIYSKRIYEILNQWKDIGKKEYRLDELKYVLGITPGLLDSKKAKDTKEKFQRHSDFDRKVMQMAQQELNQYSDITFEYEYKKTGRKFTSVLFKIRHNPNNESFEIQVTQDTLYNRLRGEYGLSAPMARTVINSLPEKVIHKACYDIRIASLNNQIKTNIGAYTAGYFRNLMKEQEMMGK